LNFDNYIETLYIRDLKLELSTLDSLNIYSESILIASLLLAILIGSYFKSALFCYLYKTRKELVSRPINLLILIQAIIQNLVYLLVVTFYVTGLFLNITYSETLGEFWCNVPWYAQVVGSVYRNFSCLGMAIFRLLLIKYNFWVKDTIGLKNLLGLTLMLSVTITVVLSIGFGMGNGPASRRQVIWNFCTGDSLEFRDIQHYYSLLTGSVVPESEVMPIVGISISLLSVVAELLCYVLFFAHLYTKDKGLLAKKLLPTHEIKRRYRKNAITFIGQFYGFVAAFVLYFGLIITLQEGSDITLRLWIVVGLPIEFGIVSVVEVMTSECLVQYLPHNHFRKK
jgi:uncharacterized membrane protein